MHDLGFMTGVTFSVGMRVELSSQQSGCRWSLGSRGLGVSLPCVHFYLF